MQHSPTQFVTSNGIELAYDSFGDDCAPVILLISGLGAQMIRWTSQFQSARRARLRVIRYDNRDCGRSSHLAESPVLDFGALAAAIGSGQRPEVPYSLDDMAADAVGLLDALSIPRAHVVGRSMGGMIAQLLASTHPDRVLSLAAIMSSTANPALPQSAPDVMALMVGPAPNPGADLAAYLSHRLACASHRWSGISVR